MASKGVKLKSIVKKWLIFARKICSRNNSTLSSISSIWVTKWPTSIMWRRESMLVRLWKGKKASAGPGSLSSPLSLLVNKSQHSSYCHWQYQRGSLRNLPLIYILSLFGLILSPFFTRPNAFYFKHLIDQVWMKLQAFIWWFCYLVKASSPKCGTHVSDMRGCPAFLCI